MDLTGKTVLITGASKGIGAEAARVFADAGANVALVARNRDAIADLAGSIGSKSIAIPCDVSRFWEVEAAVNACLKAFGSLDVLIGNAGVIEPIAHLADSDPDAWGHVIDINLKGVYNGMRAAMPLMQTQAEERSSRSVRALPITRLRGGAIIAPPRPGPPCSRCAPTRKAQRMAYALWGCRPALWLQICNTRSKTVASTRLVNLIGPSTFPPNGRPRRFYGCVGQRPTRIWDRKSAFGMKVFARK